MRGTAVGLLLVLVTVRLGGVDWVPDPLGWLLVHTAVSNLPEDFARRGLLRALAAVAGLVSVPLWFDAVLERVTAVDDSMFWALSLPQLVFCLVLPWRLAEHARERRDPGAARWFVTAAVLALVAIVLPPVVYGGGWEQAREAMFAVAALGPILLAVLLVGYSGRDWGLDSQADPEPVTGE